MTWQSEALAPVNVERNYCLIFTENKSDGKPVNVEHYKTSSKFTKGLTITKRKRHVIMG